MFRAQIEKLVATIPGLIYLRDFVTPDDLEDISGARYVPNGDAILAMILEGYE